MQAKKDAKARICTNKVIVML